MKLASIEIYLHDLYTHFSAMHDRTIYACVKYTDNTLHVFVECWIKFIDIFLQSPTRMLILIAQSLAYCFADQYLKQTHHNSKKNNAKLERKTTYTH